MPEFSQVTCVTIVAEGLVRDRLLEALVQCGARGWTIAPPTDMPMRVAPRVPAVPASTGKTIAKATRPGPACRTAPR